MNTAVRANMGLDGHRCLAALLALLAVATVRAKEPLLGPPSPSQQVVIAPGTSVRLTADHIDVYIGQRQTARLRGSAEADVNGQPFTADELGLDLTDPKAPLASAKGSVQFNRQGLSAEVDEFRADLATKTGEMIRPRLTVELPDRPRLRDLLDPEERPTQLKIEAASAKTELIDTTKKGQRRTFEAVEPRLWLPTARGPEFGIAASRALLQMGPSGKMDDHLDFFQARGAKLQVNRHTLLTLPTLHIGQGGIYLPMAGYNGTHGAWIEHMFGWQFNPQWRFRVTPRLGTIHLLSGTAVLENLSPLGKFGLNATVRERALLPVEREPVSYSRLPELTWESPRFQFGRHRGYLELDTGLGYIKEHGGRSLWRSRAEAKYINPVWRNETNAVELRALAKISYGDGGYAYSQLGAGATYEHVLFRRLWLSAGIDARWINGSTPLRHERVESPIEAVGEARWRLGNHWVLQERAAYDLERGRFTDQRAGILRRDGLLEYGLVLRTLPTFEVQLSADVLGF